jgi:two-component system nitrogen regulation response regulator NtrX
LNVLSENKIEPLGSSTEIPVNVRIISSTNKDLQELIANGSFRQDLYHRLNVLNVNVPPLRVHSEDIAELVETFSGEISERNELPKKVFTKSAIEYLSSLSWPGNVRELKNTIERILILSDSDIIDRKNIENEELAHVSELDRIVNSDSTLRDFQDISEKIFIEKKLAENNWNISKTAEALDIQRSHLYTKIKQFNIENPQKDDKSH